MRASFAISDGCSCTGPRESQFLLPATETPIFATSSRSTKEMTYAGQVKRRIQRVGIQVATQATGSPSSTHSACRFTMA